MNNDMSAIASFILSALEVLAFLFIFAIGVGVLWVIWMYIVDRLQKDQAVRRNYPVVGRFRYLFEKLGEFFRQYFFAMDREEMPFNRAERSWAYRAAKGADNTSAFGSTRNLRLDGTVIFANCAYPMLDEQTVQEESMLIGPNCQQPYNAPSFFNVSAMSYGALSTPAVRALSMGAKEGNFWLNTGEGGLSKYHLEGGCDLVMQIGTAKYGVRDLDGNMCDDKLREVAAHEQLRMFEIKLSQGAKPGKGGILPGEKVNEEIAAVRGIPAWQDSISPNRHVEVESNADLLDLVARVRDVTGKPVGIKTVLGDEDWLDELFTEINQRGIESAPDFFTLDSADGGTGAAPMPLLDDVGIPLRESLPVLVDKLYEHGLRERIRVIASGKLVNPTMAAWALCAGADFINCARGFMFALGCIQAMQCNKNTCPTGVTTHNKKLQGGLVPAQKYLRVASYANNMKKEVAIIAHSCGVSSPRKLRRKHARMVVEHGRSIPLNVLYPDHAADRDRQTQLARDALASRPPQQSAEAG